MRTAPMRWDIESGPGRVDTRHRVRAIPPAPGFDEVLMPGDPEVRTRAIRQRDGIPIAEDIWQSVTETATSLECDIIPTEHVWKFPR